MNNNIIILDDEPLAGNYLKESIEDIKDTLSFFNKFTIFYESKIQDFWDKLKELTPGIIFLDIEMPVKNGIEIAEEIKINYLNLGYKEPPIIIFCTAYDNYGYKAFTVNALDYLLKPVQEHNLIHVFEKILSLYKDSFSENNEIIYVNLSGIELQIPISEVIYFQADMKYITAHTNKKDFLLSETLLNLEKKYPTFVKIHRAYLVNSIHIKRFIKKNNHWFVHIKNSDITLPVSRRQKQELELKMDYETYFDDNYES